MCVLVVRMSAVQRFVAGTRKKRYEKFVLLGGPISMTLERLKIKL